jgi:hypothetical protein
MSRIGFRRCLCALLLGAGVLASSPVSGIHGRQDIAGPIEIEREAQSILASMAVQQEYDYILSASVRLLFFWISREDVGQGMIRIGEQAGEPGTQRLELVMGSDPAKAPFHVNRWGAAKEIYRASEGTGTFFGFMKSSGGNSPMDARADISKEKETDNHLFTGIVSRQGKAGIVSIAVPISSKADFTIRDLPQAEQMVLKEISGSSRKPRTKSAMETVECREAKGFLFTLREMLLSSLDGTPFPQTRCYFYHARRYLLTMSGGERVTGKNIAIQLRGASKPTVTRYNSLRDARFRVLNTESGERTDFRLFYGTEGDIRGIPVLMEHQPNWWFRITASLRPNYPLAPGIK